MENTLKQHVITLDSCGPVSVWVQGDEKQLKKGTVFLTVHDVGSTYQSWLTFTSHPSMADVCGRAVFLHVSLPGQDPGAPDLPDDYVFPKMRELGVGLVTVLDYLRVSWVVGLGDGAGANLITRFGMMCPGRVHGVVAINNPATASAGRFMDRLKVKMTALRDKASTLNEKNVTKFAESYKKRSEILTDINKKMKIDVLLIVGMKSKYLPDTEAIHKEMTPGLCSVIKVEDVMEPLSETPGKVAEAVFLFCQGVGLLPNVQATVARKYSREESSEEGKQRRISTSMDDGDKLTRQK